MKPEPGQTHSFDFNPSLQWQDTEIDVSAGEKYIITASGCWMDLYIPVSANGYNIPFLAEEKKRVPGQKLAALMGVIGQTDKDAFLIGKSCEKIFTVSGRLFLFVNDMKAGGFYWKNNWGKMRVDIERIA